MRFALTEGRWRGDRGKAYEETAAKCVGRARSLTSSLAPRATRRCPACAHEAIRRRRDRESCSLRAYAVTDSSRHRSAPHGNDPHEGASPRR